MTPRPLQLCSRGWSFHLEPSSRLDVSACLELRKAYEPVEWTVPRFPSWPTPYSSTAWLAHMRRMITGQQFDQVWVWLVHAPLDDAILNWVSELAPIRVGIIMESLQYSEDDYTWAPHLRARQGFVPNNRFVR
ncbi:MAG: hypothetical protein MRJ92_05750 [Nitrospira sp.]|nr:hypothetical protein [Nitrospira sp.]